MQIFNSYFGGLDRSRLVKASTFFMAGVLFVTGESSIQADPPLSNLFKRPGSKEALNKANELKAENGPWLIFAMAFEGDSAKEKAEALALDLQNDHGLPAFIMPKKFDYSEPILGSGIREDGRQKVMKYRNAQVKEGYAVLVGEFDSTESPALNPTLANVKTIKPKSLITTKAGELKNEDETIKTFKSKLRTLTKEKTPGPLETAFVTRNPLLPADFFQAPEMEKFVYDLNRDPGYNEYSLLESKGKYTVRVATFKGDDKFVSWGRSCDSDKKKNGDELTELEKAAERAYIVVKALRAAGYEAYQFHDRNQSIVTVGSFDTLGAADAKNQFVYTAGIREIVERFGPTSVVKNTNDFGVNFGPAVQPRLLTDLVDQRKIPELNQGTRKEQIEYFTKMAVGFDMRPTPMAVPRYQPSRFYAGSKVGGR